MDLMATSSDFALSCANNFYHDRMMSPLHGYGKRAHERIMQAMSIQQMFAGAHQIRATPTWELPTQLSRP